ncbi:uncharacterized protein TNCV_3675381 [Trichonephila clavipes]|nr:uncharacterized protein TNCV_3675381 [Trichonephila clavipes]
MLLHVVKPSGSVSRFHAPDSGFKSRAGVHDEERSDLSSDDLMQAVETKIPEKRRFTITTLSLEFPDDSRSVVYTIVTEDLNFKKLCSRWVPRLLTAEH